MRAIIATNTPNRPTDPTPTIYLEVDEGQSVVAGVVSTEFKDELIELAERKGITLDAVVVQALGLYYTTASR